LYAGEGLKSGTTGVGICVYERTVAFNSKGPEVQYTEYIYCTYSIYTYRKRHIDLDTYRSSID